MAIYIPEEQYVGFQVRKEGGSYDSTDGTWKGAEDIILGFATPVSSDAAFKKRKTTVDHWSRGYSYSGGNKEITDERLIPKTLKNELAEGFEIAKSVRRYGWNGGNVVWRVIDPRGFELEISSANFASIVDCATIVNGVIQGRCIWGRDGAMNVLLPENSEPYQEFAKLTALKNQVKSGGVGIKDIKPGYIITLESGDDVEYMGKFYCYTQRVEYSPSSRWQHRVERTSFDKVVERFFYKTKGGAVSAASRLKIASIVDSSKVTDLTDNAHYINEQFKSYEIVHVSIKKPTNPVVVELVSVPLSDVLEYITRKGSWNGSTFIGQQKNSGIYRPLPGQNGLCTKLDTKTIVSGSSISSESMGGYSDYAHKTPEERAKMDNDFMTSHNWFKVVVNFEDGCNYEPTTYYSR